ncbi:tripartite tricarboxylate transporter TctB family protein [Bosea sp. BIWAKO-01]|uniref:tripartite tricarboxylate transporter TctB family protein n=1 Tax=Bosea sp. BIWAKO-01 TaxID=506668 RepID=UPI00085292E6|nr:tripartite tricarboxylate transporter TctB family protein [Bosea sp. BIWAKO-01]GAU84634.1 tricarboxylate transport protein TctB [Bosea sp. BIWAKO-01]
MTKHQDVLAGGLFMLIGAATSLSALGYALGTMRRMGPGYFPLVLGLLLTGIGVALIAQAWRRGRVGTPIEWGSTRPLAFVLGGLAFFGLTLTELGFVLANTLFIGVTSYAGREFRWHETLVLSLALTVMAALVFIVGLKLQIPLWPAILGL